MLLDGVRIDLLLLLLCPCCWCSSTARAAGADVLCYCCVAAVEILHLGNINFSKGAEIDSSVLKDEKSRFHLNMTAELLR